MNVILRPMQRHEVWRAEYRARRYLEHLTSPNLEERFKDVFLNLLTIQPDAKLGVLPITPEGHYWTVQFTHLLEEFVLRYGPYPNGFTNGFMKGAPIPMPGTPAAERAATVLRGRKPLTSDQFVKYGMREHLNDLLDSGRIRIAPAATYNDSSLNRAMRDDELHLDFSPRPSELKMEVFDHRTGQSKGTIRPLGGRISVGVNTNYFVYCVSSVLAPRLFLDFGYDACIVVNSWRTFAEKLFRKVEVILPKSWSGYFLSVQYVDPVNSQFVGLDVFRVKHFRYAYQKEKRFVWMPPQPLAELEAFFVELGNLRDCCELV